MSRPGDWKGDVRLLLAGGDRNKCSGIQKQWRLPRGWELKYPEMFLEWLFPESTKNLELDFPIF